MPYSQNILILERETEIKHSIDGFMCKIDFFCETEMNNGRSTHAENGNFHGIQLTGQS